MVLVLPMYSSNSNLNIETSVNNNNNNNNDLLNINGKRYNRNSSKTIWSYNPDDVSIKKFNTKWRPNTSLPTKASTIVTNNFVSTSFNCKQLIDEYQSRSSSSMRRENIKLSLQPKTYKEDEMFIDNNILNENGISVQQSLLSPRMSMNRKSSSSSSNSNDKRNKLQTNIVANITQTDKMNQFLESNTSASRRIRMQQFQLQLQEQHKKETLVKQKLNSIEFDKQQNIIKSREFNSSRQSTKVSKLNADIKKMIDKLNNDGEDDDDDDQPIVYGKHIDNLTTELFVALSNGIDKNVFMKRTPQSFKEKSSSSSIRTSSTNLQELLDAEQEELQEDNFVLKICNEIKNFQLGNTDNDEDLKKNTRSKTVKIVEEPEFLKRPGKNIVPDTFRGINKLLNSDQISDEMEMTIFPTSYFDPKFNENDYNYRYKKVLNEPFISMLDQYDGNLPVEVVLKQSLPLNDYYASLSANTGNNNNNNNNNSTITRNERSSSTLSRENNENPRKSSAKSKSNKINKKIDDGTDTVYVNKDYEMYNILKRMMVKKKYEIATIKLEKAIDKRKRRCQSSLSLTPNTSAPNLINNNSAITNGNIKIKMRPSTSFSLTPSATSNNLNGLTNCSLLSKPFTEDDNEEDENIDQKDDEYLVGEKIIRCAKCKKRLNMKKNDNEDEDVYEEFSISNDTIKKNQWPYELDSKQIINDQENDESTKQSKLYRCYTCTNLPSSDSYFFTKSEPLINYDAKSGKQLTKSQKNVTIAENATQSSQSNNLKSDKSTNEQQQQFQSATYNSARRALSAKNIRVINQELTDHADKVEFQNLTCSHPRKMSNKELLQYQRSRHLIPGKTFSSQRRQSISSNRVPLSKIKADYEKENLVSHLYPLVKFSTTMQTQKEQEQQQQHQEQQNHEVTRQEIRKTGNTENKTRGNIALKNFKIDPFIPSPVPRIKLFQTNQLDQQTGDSKDSNNVLSAFHVYKKTTKLIRKRPKTAK